MPQLDLGRVKGDPFLYEDLTEEQKLELKGEKGDMPIVKAGTTTIVEYEQGAKVTSETNGDVTSFNFQIPIGQKPPFYGAYADFPEVGDSNRTYIDDTVDPRLIYTWDDTTQAYVLTGGAGGADGGSVDIPITLTSADWTGTTAPYQQTVTLPQMREGMTPLYFLASDGDDAQYAFGLIIDYQVGYAEITFYAADRPAVDLNLTLKGIPAQEMEYVDNTVVFLVEPSAFALNDTTQRYEATIPVEGMTAGTGGTWDIVRSGPVLTEAESKIALYITDVDRLDGAVKISCLEVPEQRYMMSISGAYPDAEPGTIILANMQEWFDRMDALEGKWGKIPELAIDFDDAPLLNILTANNQSINKPPQLSSNAFLLLQLLPHNKNYSAQVAFGFGDKKIAMRTRASGSSTTWSDWDYFVPKSYIDNKINIMDSGTFMFDNTEANGNSQKAISFSKTFNTIPNVVICPSSTANPKGREMATIDVTKTGFTATLHNASGEVISPYATWIAIGN